MSSKVVRLGGCRALGFAAVMMASAASAEEAPETRAQPADPLSGGDEALQLTLQGSLLDYQKHTFTPNQGDGSSTQPEERKTSATSYGLVGSGLGIGLGYAWDQLLVGARAQLTTTSVSPAGGGETQSSTVALFPRVEYMFKDASSWPFIAGLLSIDHASSSQTSANNGAGTATIDDSSTRLGFGAAFGIHAFLNQAVSLDPEIAVLYSAGSGSTKISGEGLASSSLDYSLSTVRVLLSVGLSGWIDTGGAPTPPPPRDEPTLARAPAVAAAPAATDEPDAEVVSADIRLPNYRRLYVQVFKDAAKPFVLVRITEPRGSFALRECESVAIWENGSPIKLAVRSHGDHYLTGRLPLHGLEVLVSNPDSTIAVCSERWQLGQESREAVQSFLNARRDLLEPTDETEAAPTPPAAPSPPTPEAPAEAPAKPSAAPPTSASAPPAAKPAKASAPPEALPKAATPTGAFPAAPEATPSKGTPPKK